LPIDTYKGNGRLRHESVNIQLGPFANIQLHSYQAGELKDIHLDHTDAGGLHHFEILIFRNTGLIGGEPFQRVTLNDLPPHRYSNASYFSTGHVERSKENCLIDFLTSNRKGESDLARHALSIRILSQAYLALSKQTTEEKKSVRFDINDLLDSLDHSEKANHEYQNL